MTYLTHRAECLVLKRERQLYQPGGWSETSRRSKRSEDLRDRVPVVCDHRLLSCSPTVCANRLLRLGKDGMKVRKLDATSNRFRKRNEAPTNALTLTNSQRERELET